MKIAVISDVHDQWDNLDRVLAEIKKIKPDELWVLGDFCSPPTLRRIGESGLKCRMIYGNNDGDAARMIEVAKTFGGRLELATGDNAEYMVGGSRVFVTHYPEIAKLAAGSGEYAAVFYGHDHVAHREVLSSGCVLGNPGEVWGYKTGMVSFGVWDSGVNEFEIVEV